MGWVTLRFHVAPGGWQKLAGMGRKIPDSVRDALDSGIGSVLHPRLMNYPPIPPRSHYKRTYNLQRSWYWSNIGAITFEVVNFMDYAGKVKGENQWALHAQNGWIKASNDLVSATPQLVAIVKQAIDNVIGAP
jgi:hypothetical protein